MVLCKSCGEVLPADDDCVKCINSCLLHYACAGIAEKSWRQWARAKRESYRCVICRGNRSESSSVKSVDSMPDLQGIVQGENFPTLPENFFERIEKLIESTVHSAIEKKLSAIVDKLKDVEKSVDFCSGKIDDFTETMKVFSERIQAVEKNNHELTVKNRQLENELASVKLQVEELNQYGRNHNILIEGIPEVPGEKIMDLVNKLAVKVDEQIVLNVDVQAAHRVPARDNSKPKPLVVQFTNRQKRDAVLKKARQARPKSTDFVSGVPATQVYVNEHLTPFYRKLFFEAKQAKIKKSYSYLWVSNSKIFMRRDTESKPVRISCMSDLEKL